MPSGSSRLEGTVQKERCIAGGGGGAAQPTQTKRKHRRRGIQKNVGRNHRRRLSPSTTT